MDLKLKGKIALVTGSSSGLGLATAQALVREGARVALNGRNPEKVARAVEQVKQRAEDEVIGLTGDLVETSTAARLVEETAARFGGLDILITNAGGPPSGRFDSFDDAAWQHAVEISFLSHVRLIRAALPYLRRSEAPAVLTVTSSSVKQPIDNLVLSNSVRLATIGLTKSLAIELGRDGIRFNSILPSWTETGRVKELMNARASHNQTSVDEETNKLMQQSPLGRMAQPEEFAAAAVFLVSPVASYITGVMLSVDGGMVRSTF